MPEEPRRDLTHLQALAIDDEGSHDPDDALSWDNGRLWVHIADAAALIPPDSEADIEARARGANLYLPGGTVTMLPPEATQILALGLGDLSPALSFGLDLDETGQIVDFEIVPSLVQVTRLSYDEAETRLEESPFKELLTAANQHEARRQEKGAINIDLPEVKVRAVDGTVEIVPLPNLRSRDLVREAMLLAGEAAARYAVAHDLALPYTSQDAPAVELPVGDTPSVYFATRMMLKPGNKSTSPGLHAGLGMRSIRPGDQPFAPLPGSGRSPAAARSFDGQATPRYKRITTLIGSADSGTRDVRRTERLSNQHWTASTCCGIPTGRVKGLWSKCVAAGIPCCCRIWRCETSVYAKTGTRRSTAKSSWNCATSIW